jgi:hypothetical protein
MNIPIVEVISKPNMNHECFRISTIDSLINDSKYFLIKWIAQFGTKNRIIERRVWLAFNLKIVLALYTYLRVACYQLFQYRVGYTIILLDHQN